MPDNSSQSDRLLKELVDIKRLLVAGLMKTGMSQREVAKALGVNQSSISRMFASAARESADESSDMVQPPDGGARD
jgi:predicted transcriptional regulator